MQQATPSPLDELAGKATITVEQTANPRPSGYEPEGLAANASRTAHAADTSGGDSLDERCPGQLGRIAIRVPAQHARPHVG
jgi:hypothetical protein